MVLPLPISVPVFSPTLQTIASITNALVAIITTDLPHGYQQGLYVRLDIPQSFGMQQANGIEGAIAILSPTTFLMLLNSPIGIIPLDTSTFDVFAVPATVTTPAQVIPTGEITSTLLSATQNILPL